MSYTALYRRLRPSSFEGVIGQEHITRTLKNQIINSRVTHAYLFCGTRGTGKTSTAKIFAKAVNCHEPVDGEPCGKCVSCINIDRQSSLNVIEIDAASNNGVDNIRDIREEVKYPPAEGRYKVYIIDEVHMLSTGAFNALLKTLEEPPAHVLFVLATTDPQKIPPTILSRCQRMDFRRITIKDMTAAMQFFMEDDQVVVEESAIDYIARLSDGALRDAYSLLDQCIAFYSGETITLQKVLDITGSVDKEVFFRLADTLKAFDSSGCIELIDDIVQNGRDVSQFVSEYIVHLRNVLVAGTTGAAAVDAAGDLAAQYEAQGKALGKDRVIRYIEEFSALQQKMRYSINDRILLETACIRLCNPGSPEGGGDVALRLLKLEQAVENGLASGTSEAKKKAPLAK